MLRRGTPLRVEHRPARARHACTPLARLTPQVFATWCLKCKAVLPELSKLAAAQPSVRWVLLDHDENEVRFGPQARRTAAHRTPAGPQHVPLPAPVRVRLARPKGQGARLRVVTQRCAAPPLLLPFPRRRWPGAWAWRGCPMCCCSAAPRAGWPASPSPPRACPCSSEPRRGGARRGAAGTAQRGAAPEDCTTPPPPSSALQASHRRPQGLPRPGGAGAAGAGARPRPHPLG